MFEFSWPWLFLLIPLPLLLLLLKPIASNSNTRLRIPGFAKHALNNPNSAPQSRRLSIFEWLLWLLLVSAAANPTWQCGPN